MIVYDEVQFSLHQSEINPDALNLSKTQRAAGLHRTDRQTDTEDFSQQAVNEDASQRWEGEASSWDM